MMENHYTEATYGERVADIYDEWYSVYDEAAIDRLCELAGKGRALELGIGTGRIALPLLQRGVDIQGIDASPAMVEKLRQKPGGERIPVTMGNFARIPVDGPFSLIYVLFNTFFGLLTQDEQVSCFESAARRLDVQGVFLIEAFVPDMKRFTNSQAVHAVDIQENQVRIDAARIDPSTQQIISQHILLSEEGVRLFPVRLRFVYPAEMDLMARLAGLRLLQRDGNWEGDAFTADSTKHISIYGKEG
jgi:SAM-dependent methyltransferase